MVHPTRMTGRQWRRKLTTGQRAIEVFMPSTASFSLRSRPRCTFNQFPALRWHDRLMIARSGGAGEGRTCRDPIHPMTPPTECTWLCRVHVIGSGCHWPSCLEQAVRKITPAVTLGFCVRERREMALRIRERAA